MSSNELHAILDKGLTTLEMGIEPAVRRRIVYFSSGFPHYTHLLGKYSARECINDKQNTILDKHYRRALDAALDDVTQSVHTAFQMATRSEEHTSELQSLMRISYAVFCLKKKNTITQL